MSSQIRNAYVTIYSSNDKSNDYTTQGFGVLSDLLKGVVHAKLNGELYFEGTYPAKAPLADKISERNIIQCYVDENKARQLLRIYNVQKSMLSNLIEFKAEPIWNDTRKHVINKWDSSVANTAQASFNGAKQQVKPAWDNRFTFHSSVSTLARQVIEKANILEFFGGKEGSVLDTYHGEFVKDNYVLRHVPRLGQDHKLKAVYTKNMTGLDFEIDSQSVLIGVYPYVKLPETENEQDKELHITGEVLYTEYADQFPSGIIQFVEFKDIEKEEDLRRAAQAWLTQNKKKQSPTITGSIEFVPLRKQKGYEKFVDLEKVSLGDGVDVWHPDLEIEMSARIVEYDYNVLTDSYEKITIGEVKSNFLENQDNKINNIADLMNKAINEITSKGEISDLIRDMVDHQTDLITGNSGGYVVLEPKTSPSRILIMDTPDKKTARNVLQINQNGIGFSKTGVNGTYETAWTLDGGFNASFITAGEISGITLRGNTLISEGNKFKTTIADGAITWYSEKKKRDVIQMHAQETSAADVGELFYQIKKGGGFRILDTAGNLVMSTWDNGTSAGSWLSFSSRELHWFGTRKSSDGSITYESMDHNSSYFRVKVNNKQLKFDSDGGLTISDVATFNDVVGRINKNTIIAGNLSVSGSKNSSVATQTYGRRLLNAYETPEYYFADYGEAVTGDDCKVRVDIDPMFAETVNLSRYMTHVTPTELVLCAVTHEDRDHFIIETSKPNVLVRWNLVAHRLDYEHVRLTRDYETAEHGEFDQKHF